MPKSLNFDNLIPFGRGNSQNDAFEELICQLARDHSHQKGANDFRRVATPDAGKECYAVFENGDRWHWQAKFFQTSINNHKNVKKYFVCLPKDFPDGSGGKSENNKWDEIVNELKTWAEDNHEQEVEIELWGASEIADFLSKNEHAGRRKFWFGEIEIRKEKLDFTVIDSIQGAGERYHSDINVEIDTKKNFDALALRPKFVELFCKQFQSISEKRCFTEEINKQVQKLLECSEGLLESIKQEKVKLYSFQNIRDNLQKTEDLVRKSINERRDKYWEIKRKEYTKLSEEERNFNSDFESLDNLDSQIIRTKYFFDREVKSTENPLILLIGKAMVGKTHLFCDIAKERIENNLPTILCLGDQFNNLDHPIEQLSKFLDLKVDTREELLQALNSFAESQNERLLIMIDAINESDNRKIWSTNLHTVVNEIKKYPGLALAISVRDSEMDNIITEDLRKHCVQILHPGFEGKILEALKIFCNNFNLSLPQIPIFDPEFENPGFLYITCKTLSEEGETKFIANKGGLQSLFDKYIQLLNKNLINKLELPSGINYVNRTISCLIPSFYESDSINFETAQDTLVDELKRSIGERSINVLEALINMSLFRRFTHRDNTSVGFSYQRVKDYLTAKDLVSKTIDKENIQNSFNKSSKLYLQCFDSHGDRKRVNRSFVNALSIIIPEEFGMELIYLAYQNGNSVDLDFVEAFCESLIWRSKESLNDSTKEIINKILKAKSINYRWPALKSLLNLATIPEHPFNAYFLHDYLIEMRMNDRDEHWSMFIQSDDEGHGHTPPNNRLDKFIEWILNIDSPFSITKDVRILAAIVLAWSFTSSNRFTRDNATKCLSKLLVDNLDISIELLELFGNVNDIYVEERLIASIYGSIQESKNLDSLGELAENIFNRYFSNGSPKPHILLRDYARGIVEFAFYKKENISIDKSKIKPPYKSNFPGIPPENIFEDYKLKYQSKDTSSQFSAFHCLYSSIENEWTGDFNKYVLSSCSSYFINCLLKNKRPSIEKKEREKSFENSLNNSQRKRKKKVKEFKDKMVTSLKPDLVKIDEGNNIKFQIELSCDQALVKKYENEKKQLRTMLSKEQFCTYIKLNDESSFQESQFDKNLAARWIFKRVFDLGWNPEQFSSFDSEINRSYLSRDGRKVERIAKKYQWIAFHEFLAYLTDNYHYGSHFSNDNEAYDGPWQLSARDIDPTFTLKFKDNLEEQNQIETSSWAKPSYTNKEIFEDSKIDIPQFINLNNPDGEKFTLVTGDYEWKEEEEKLSLERSPNFSLSFKRKYNLYVDMLLVRKSEKDQFVEEVKNKKYFPGEFTHDLSYQHFYSEYFWRFSSDYFNWKSISIDGNDSQTKLLPAVLSYRFENSHDCSFNNGERLHLLNRKIIEDLNLSKSRNQYELLDTNNKAVCIDTLAADLGFNGLVLSKDLVDKFCEKNKVEPIWFVFNALYAMETRGVQDTYSVWHCDKGYSFKELYTLNS
ncbi:MAG: hypothetical protein QNJ31_05375 [Candidatus Caenarcaniphilales bacterium]|nr:hypothetical protein [Candidatus Caenarcaniphilales bacterium]